MLLSSARRYVDLLKYSVSMMFKRKIPLQKWQVKCQVLKLALLAPVQRKDKECCEGMSQKFGNHVETQPEN